ncbi:thiol:disulfide interchange protein DsbD [Salmonella enterica subsp. indica]|uniref:Thiol:disulfide interchange protein DsbD n=1 Tax=Salmonella enterica subsp. indica TaxID=59207 RepID=A0A379XW86_SALER|nr:thiol:disulfide interchange protein DsbD [Salmonella enterica subsp. indica]
MAQRIFTLILLLCSTSAFAGLFDAPGRSQFVPADRAFVFDFQQNQHDLTLSWQVKEGYYLYRKQISITPTKADIAAVQLPAGVWHEDEFYGKSEIYRKRLNVPVTVNQAAAGATLTVTYQGCADAGFCYPPETKTVPLSEVAAAIDATPTPAVTQAGETSKPATQLPFSALWALLIGIGIAFTPCVLPMYPLISGIVPGGKTTFVDGARSAAGFYLRTRDGADLYRTGPGRRRGGITISGGAAAPLCVNQPCHRVHPACVVDVWPVHTTAPLLTANPA